MKLIGTTGYDKPKSVQAGAPPRLQWLSISDLVIDPAYQAPISGKGRRNVEGIVRSFSWSRFATVVVAPVEGGKFAIIDGRHRTTAAAVAGFTEVPCQIVTAVREERVVASKAINGCTSAVSRMSLHAAGMVASDPWAVRLADACARAEVELLRYPVPIDRQSAGQSMAIGAIARCLRRYGEETLITALQCVTQTTNNKQGALSARTIKALCAVLGTDQALRDSGLKLLEMFDRVDLLRLANAPVTDVASKKINSVQAMADQIRLEISLLASGRLSLQPSRLDVETPREKIQMAIASRNPTHARTRAERRSQKV